MKILSYLNLNNVGSLEILFAFLLILGPYNIAGIPLLVFCPMLLVYLTIRKFGKLQFAKVKPIIWFLVFYLAHEFVWLFVMKTIPGYFINATITSTFYLLVIMCVGETFDYNKLKGSINWVAIISMIGMFYHFSITVGGGTVTTLSLPFLSSFNDTLVVRDVSKRPLSFFAEPAAYATFMIIPLYLALLERKYLWGGVIIISILMSSSTTGLAQSFLMVAFFLLTQKIKAWVKVMVSVGMAGILTVLLVSNMFSQTVEKAENTDVESTVRTAQGPLIVMAMQPEEFILGGSYASAYDYCINNPIGNSVVYYGQGVYMATFWLIILRFGIIGLLFYLGIYVYFIIRDRTLMPFIITLIPTLFSSGYAIGLTFCFQFCFVVTVYKHNKILKCKNL